MNRKRKPAAFRSTVFLSLLVISLLLMPLAEGGQEDGNTRTPVSNGMLNLLTEQERAWLRDHPVITVAHDPDWAPVEFSDKRGELTGMSADYLNLVEQRLGVKFKRIPNLSWQEAFARQKSWEIDMATCVAAATGRSNFWAFTKPYLNIPIVIATHSEVGYIGDMKELFGKRVAVVKNYAIDDWVTHDYPEINLVRFNNVPEGLAALQRGEVFAYLDNLLIIGDYQAKLKVFNIKIAGQTPYVNAQRMAVRKDWAPLAGILDKALDSISEAERGEIYRKWVPIRYEHGFNYTLLWQALAVFAAIILGLLLWNRKLTREMKFRRRAEEALRESEERLRLALKGANQGIYDLNVQTGDAQVTPEYATMLGYDPETFRETNAAWLERLHPEDHEPVAAIYRDYVSGRIPEYRVEFRQRAKSGDWKWILSLGKIVEWDSAGQPLRMLGTHTNITERKQAEAALRESEETFRKLYEDSPDPILLMQGKRFIRCNSATLRFLGVADERRFLGSDPMDISPERQPDGRLSAEAAPEYIAKAHAEGFCRFEWLCKTYADVPFLLEVTLMPITLRGEKLLHITWRDITERKRAEEALRKSEERFAKAFDSSPDAIVLSKIDSGELLEVNTGFGRVFGYSRDEAIGKTTLDLGLYAHPADRIRMVQMLKREGRIRELELEGRRKSGELIKALLSVEMMELGSEQLMITTVRDITERKRAEEALQQSEATYREIFNTVNDAIWVHDIETFDFLDANNKAAEMFGYSISEALGLTVGDISSDVPPFTLKTAAEYMKKAAAGEPQLFDWHARHKDGHLFWTEVNLKQGTIAGRECLLAIERDITERKRAEEALRESEENYRSLIQNIQAAVVVHGPDTRILTCNSMAQKLLGLTEDQLLGKTAIDKAWYFFNTDRTKMGVEEYPVNQVIARRRTLRNFIAGVHRPNKEPENDVWVLVNADPVFVNDEIVQVIVTFIDISDRKRAEEALRESEKNYQSLFDNAQVALFRTGIADGKLLEINERYAKMAGYSNIYDCMAEFNAADAWTDPNARIELRRILSEKGFVTDYETEIIRRDGNHSWILFSATIFPEQGFIEGSIMDITERKRVEEELHEKSRFIASLLRAIPVAVFYKDREGRYQGCNDAFTEIMGVTADDIRGKTVHELWPSELANKYHQMDLELMRHRQHQKYEFKVKAKDGEMHPVIYVKDVYLDNHGEVAGLVGAFLDITERKRAEEALRSSLEEKESLLREVHHRVKNNLQVISSILNLQFRQVENDEVRSFLRDTQNRIRSMAMLHEILYHSENKARINFPQYVKDLCAQLARSLGSKARKISVQQEIVPVALNLDQTVTAGLIINELVTNAFKHAFPSSSEGKILVQLQAPDEHHLLLRVSDDGIGFPPESPPQRSESLGLLLVKNLSRQLEGRLSVTGRTGTVFEIIFPLNPLER